MRRALKLLIPFFVFFMLFNNGLFASEGHQHFSGDPVSTMANIVIGLNHFPNNDEKKKLEDIIAHSKDDNIKSVAMALLNMRHSASDEDKAKLEKVMNEASASADIKLLAKVIHGINHKPSSADKDALAPLVKK